MKIPLGLKKVSALCVLRNGQQFLLLKRFNEPNKDCYTPVGGKVESFENPLKTAFRETFEETGIELNNMKYQGILTESSPTKYNWICYVYVAEIDMVEPPFCDEGILEWIDFKDLLSIPTPESDWYIYKYILEEKMFAFNAEYDEHLNLIYMSEDLENEIVIGDEEYIETLKNRLIVDN